MDKITVKELPIGIRFKVTKKRLLSIPKIVRDKVSGFYHNVSDKIKNYVSEDEKKAALKGELNKFDAKRKDLSVAKKQIKKNTEISTNEKKYYLEAIDEELEKIKSKRKRRKAKGLGVYSLGKLYVSKYIKVQQEKVNKIKAKKELEKILKEQIKLENEENELKQKLEKLNLEKNSIIEKRNESIKNKPELEKYFEKISITEKEKDSEKIVVPVTEIRKATEEEQKEVKKSSKYKKAIAALTAIAIAAGIALGVATNHNNIKNETPVAYSQEETKEQTDKITLNDYVNLENGSTIFDSPKFDGKSGKIGTNGYDNNTLFKVNAISYIDENNNVNIFNYVGQDEEQRKIIEEKHTEYIKNNPKAIINSVHVTPCNDSGEPEMANELGGWINIVDSQVNKVDFNNINQQNLGGMSK